MHGLYRAQILLISANLLVKLPMMSASTPWVSSCLAVASPMPFETPKLVLTLS